MASFPGAKKKSPSRRKLGRGQHVQIHGFSVVVTTTTPVVHLNFSVPVIVNGNIPLAVVGLTRVSQTIVSPTRVDITMSGPTTGLAYTLPAGDPSTKSAQGGVCNGATGTF
jgi:hypothetical protein